MLTKSIEKFLLWILVAIIAITVMIALFNLRGCERKKDTLNEVTIETNKTVNEDKQNAKKLNQAIDNLPAGGLIDRVLPPVSAGRRDSGQNSTERIGSTHADADQPIISGHERHGKLGAATELPVKTILGRETAELLSTTEDSKAQTVKPWYLPKTPQRHLNGVSDLTPCYGIPDCTVPDNE